MFVTISRYQVRTGEEDAILALHEHWQLTLQSRAKGYLSGALLRNIENLREFVSIRYFESQEAAEVLANNPEQDAWYQRVVSLTEDKPITIRYTCEWRDTQ
jgi:heme-degrading monooxygenase HmoA